MFYKSLYDYSLDDESFLSVLSQIMKVSFDGKTEIRYKEIDFFQNLGEPLSEVINYENSVDLANSLNILDSFCYLDDFRPDPNQLLYQTPLFLSICKILESTDKNDILFLCAHILVHLSLADYRSNSPISNPALLQLLVSLLGAKIDPIIHHAILDFLFNISLNQDFFLDDFIKVIIFQISQVCISTNSSKVLIMSYKISTNFARLIYEKDLIYYFIHFNCMIQSLISSLKPCTQQSSAIELLSYLFYNLDCCKFSLDFDIIDKIKDSLKNLPKNSISDAFTAINSLISNCNLIDQFLDNFIIKKAMISIKQIDHEEIRPLFVFIDSLCENHVSYLENCGTIEYLCDLIDDSSLAIKKKSVFVLAHLIDQNWMKNPKPKWIDSAIISVIENMHSLSNIKVETVLKILIEIHNFNPNYYYEIISKTDFLGCLEDVNDMDGISENLIDYTNFLIQTVSKIEQETDDIDKYE